MYKRFFGSVTPLYLLLVVVLLYGGSTTAQQKLQAELPRVQVPIAQEQPSDSPVALPGPAKPTLTLNFTQPEYENAVAKWRSHGITEYEITFRDSTYMTQGGHVRLRFKVEQGEPTLVTYTDLNGEQPRIVPLATVTNHELQFLVSRSVEEMLHLLGTLFTGQPSTYAFGNDYDVAFDPALGYPLHVDSEARAPGLGPVSDCCIYYEVLELKVLESTGTPGMPKTGSLSP